MSLTSWLFINGIFGGFYLWILKWGGAKWLEGWKSFFVIGWFAAAWSGEQIRLYVLCGLLFHIPWFIAGLFVPEWRG